MRLRHAFTLIELLVVISIITLLLAILIPALRMARETAKDMACMSNERQLGLYLQVYIDEHNGHLPPNDSTLAVSKSHWNKRDVVQSYIGVQAYDPADFTVHGGVFACPSVENGLMTYTMNSHLRNPVPTSVVADPNLRPVNPLLHVRPSKLVTLFDGRTVYQEGRTSAGVRWNSDYVDFRHPRDSRDPLRGKANFLCFDGHVEKQDWYSVTRPPWGERLELVWN